ncbi:hypothetical protein [Chitinophaga sp. MM2321]|uniref:WDGH domain-containing protein n=1 Tax=Chitinophaga sp. MM2321 TaxID=3137178 RepID=UPI0032D598D7
MNAIPELNNDLTVLTDKVSSHINTAIKIHSLRGLLNTNEVSDGYHTFGELYDHRCVLWVKLCEMLFDIDNGRGELNKTWKSLKNADGISYAGWFILGYGHNSGEQITYHLPVSYWDMTYFAKELESHEFDGHTSVDVLKRLKEL